MRAKQFPAMEGKAPCPVSAKLRPFTPAREYQSPLSNLPSEAVLRDWNSIGTKQLLQPRGSNDTASSVPSEIMDWIEITKVWVPNSETLCRRSPTICSEERPGQHVSHLHKRALSNLNTQVIYIYYIYIHIMYVYIYIYRDITYIRLHNAMT